MFYGEFVFRGGAIAKIGGRSRLFLKKLTLYFRTAFGYVVLTLCHVPATLKIWNVFDKWQQRKFRMEFHIGNQSLLPNVDNDDDKDDTKNTHQIILDPSIPTEDSSSPLWWKKVPWSTTKEDTSASSSTTPRKDHDFEHAASYKSMDEDTTTMTQLSSTSQQYADVVQDCSFFFHDTKDNVLANNSILSNSWSLNATTTANTTSSTTNNAAATKGPSTISLSSVIPPRYRAAFRARYQQLNLSSLAEYPTDDNQDDHELWLQDESVMSNLPVTYNHLNRQVVEDNNIPYVSWYVRPKIHIPLPKDRVRLLLDDEMEPGILSIERGGTISTRIQSHPSSSFLEEKDEDDALQKETPPPTTIPHPHSHHHHHHDDDLVYVLTVDSDLYQRIVGEISDALSSRWGWYRIEEGRVDITLAILALGFVFFFMLLATILLRPVE